MCSFKQHFFQCIVSHYSNQRETLNMFKVPVKSKLSMCSEFVTPQKNV